MIDKLLDRLFEPRYPPGYLGRHRALPRWQRVVARVPPPMTGRSVLRRRSA